MENTMQSEYRQRFEQLRDERGITQEEVDAYLRWRRDGQHTTETYSDARIPALFTDVGAELVDELVAAYQPSKK